MIIMTKAIANTILKTQLFDLLDMLEDPLMNLDYLSRTTEAESSFGLELYEQVKTVERIFKGISRLLKTADLNPATPNEEKNLYLVNIINGEDPTPVLMTDHDKKVMEWLLNYLNAYFYDDMDSMVTINKLYDDKVEEL